MSSAFERDQINTEGAIAVTAVKPEISVIVPVFNEQAVLADLFPRLYAAMDQMGRSYEILFVDDGSRDRSPALLRTQYQARPDVTRVILLQANAGQHPAIMAGFTYAKGSIIVTLDADLQNPPEEIAKLVAQIDDGYDYVGGVRRLRRDRKWRHYASRLMNYVRERTTAIHMTDQGCMLRAYRREIVAALVASKETQTFIPALAYLYANNPTEVTVEHDERVAGESKYSLFKLIQLNFDLITGFSVAPLQVISLLGLAISFLSFVFVTYLAVRRLVVGPEVEGVFTLFGIAFFMIGLLLSAVGVLGEYLGRIYIEVRGRPRFLVAAVLEREADSKDGDEA